jgi:hypothetical protein
VTEADWLRVPIGENAARWSSMPSSRIVLAVARTMTSTLRLLDVLPELLGDPRVQVLFTRLSRSPWKLVVAAGV